MAAPAWYQFVKRRQPSPGAQGFALACFRIPTEGLVGNATMRIQGLRINQPPQSAQLLHVPLEGYGGPVAGQYVGQPLFDLSDDGMSTRSAFEG